MTRRRAVVLISGAILLTLGGALALGLAMLTRTAWGLEHIRAFAERSINGRIKGKIHIGRISGSIFSALTIDSVSLSEKNDSLFVATGPISLRFDPRDLFDRRIYARSARIHRPVVRVEQDSTGTWNFRKIFPPGPKAPPKSANSVAFGDFVVVDSAVLDSVRVRVLTPWSLSDSLHGAKRDSALAYVLGRTDRPIRRSGSTLSQILDWSNGRIEISHARVDDHTTAGRQFEISHLSIDEYYPPFKVRDARGSVRIAGDSIWVNIPHFRLPGSKGSAAGKIWWGSGLPTRYDLAIDGDSVALADVAWVYPTLPTMGGGSMKLRIHNERNLHVLDYAISDMDVRTMQSRLRGDMTFGTGAEVLIVKDVDVRADPMDWAFLHQINGKPLPYPWRGTLTGVIRARGGPVNRFDVDSADLVFRDANVPGAGGHVRGKGELDILFPAFTVFRGFNVTVDQFDLRSIQFLNPAFPRFDGLVSGSARLDSSWLDVRFRNADITHRDGPGVPNHFTGSGRVTYGAKFLTYDLALDAKPISFTTIAHAYREIPLPYRGEYEGPIRLQGTMEDLALSADINGTGGRLAYEGSIDADSVGGYAADGVFRFRNLDLRVLFDTTSVPHTMLNGEATPRLRGDSLATLVGALSVDVDRSFVDSVRIYGGGARARFTTGRLTLDSLGLESALGSLVARGSLGVAPAVNDSITFSLRADSLGALRRYYVRPYAGDTTELRLAEAESLEGQVTIDGIVFGSVDSLRARATLSADRVKVAANSARSARIAVDLMDLTGKAHGQVSFIGDTVVAGGISMATIGGTADVQSRRNIRYRFGTNTPSGSSAEAGGRLELSGDTAVVMIDSLAAILGGNAWRLVGGTKVVSSDQGVDIDTLTLTGGSRGRLVLGGSIPTNGPVALTATADSVSMADLGALAQTRVSLGGVIDAQLRVSGTRESPTMTLRGSVREGQVGDVSLQRVTIAGEYGNERANGTMALERDGVPVLNVDASIPADLRLRSVARRLLDDTLHVTFRSKDVDLALLEAFIPSLNKPTGRLNADASLRGRIGQTILSGYLRVDSAAASLDALGETRVRNVFVDLVAERDTVRIRRLVGVSGPERSDSLWLGGFVALTGADTVPSYDVQFGARGFRVVVPPRLADLQFTSDLRIAGDVNHSTLTGGMTIDRGVIYIPPFFDKDVVSLDDPDLYNIVDTTVITNRTLLPKAPPKLLQNLDVRNVAITMGSDVRLRSDEANIKLGGAVNVTVARQAARGGAPTLALDGRLRTEQGTYLLDLGVTQRLLTIEGGELRFFGDADLNPTLDITALHTVRQFTGNVSTRNDIRIRVRLQGTFLQPRISFESADSLALSESDLISYLVTGAPSNEIGGTRGAVSSIVTSVLTGYLQRTLTGRLFDQVQVQSASNQFAQSTPGSSFFSQVAALGLQFGLGKQINDRTWVSLTAGLCSGTQTQSTLFSKESIGVKVEYQLGDGYGVSFGVEPGTKAVLCGQERGFAPTPQQIGLDFSRAWRF